MTQVEKLKVELENRYGVTVDEFLDVYKEKKSTEEMASILGCKEYLVRTYASTLNLRLPKKFRAGDYSLYLTRFDESSTSLISNELEEAHSILDHLSKEVVGKEKQLITAKAQISKYKSQLHEDIEKSTYEQIMNDTVAKVNMLKPQNIAIGVPPRSIKNYSGYTQFILLSDLHFEEAISRKDVGQANEFNWDIAKVRLGRVFSESVRSYRGEKKIVVMSGGDIFSGIIHDTLESTTKPLGEAVAELATILSGYLIVMSSIYEEVYMPCIHGNHGRISEHKKATGQGFNFEYLFHQILKAQLAAYTNIKIEISTTGLLAFNCNGKTIGLHHGDMFRFSGDMKFLRVKEAFRQTTGLVPDNIFQGHTHKFSIEEMPNSGKYITNGSLTGINGYCHTNGFLGLDWGQTIGTITPTGKIDYIKLVGDE